MNEKARALGLKESHFRSPSGLLDRDNYSTAWDMAALARYAMWNPRFRAVVRTQVKHVPWAPPTYEKIYVNKNHLIGDYPGANGVEDRLDDDREALPRRRRSRRNGVWLIAVVLGADDSYADVKKLLDCGFVDAQLSRSSLARLTARRPSRAVGSAFGASAPSTATRARPPRRRRR